MVKICCTREGIYYKMKSSKSAKSNKISESLNLVGEETNNEEEEKIPKKMMKLKVDREDEKFSTIRLGTQFFKQIRYREISSKPIRKPQLFEQNKNSCLHQRDLKAHTGCVNAVDFSPGEEWIASGGDDLRVRLWKTVDCCTSSKPESSSVLMKSIHHSNIFALRFSHKSERIYSAGNDHRLLVHDIKTRERLRTYRASSSIYHIATHPADDNMIAASSDDRNVYLFDLRGNEGDGLCTKLRQEGCAYSVCWNPQNHHLVAVCNDKSGLLVYDLRMESDKYFEAGSITKKAICADWSPSGDALFCAISRSNPICFNMITSQFVQLKDPNYSNFCTIKSCTFADQNYMLTGSDDWNIYVWKMPNEWPDPDIDEEEGGGTCTMEKAHMVLKGHRSIVNHVKFGERSNLLISCGVEKIVKFWSPLPLYDSYTNPKPRPKFSNKGLLSHIHWHNMHGGDESDVEEDLATLHRFDFYFENFRNRQEQSAWMSDSSGEEDDSVNSFEAMFSNINGETNSTDDNDDESFWSEIADDSATPTPYQTPNSPLSPNRSHDDSKSNEATKMDEENV